MSKKDNAQAQARARAQELMTVERKVLASLEMAETLNRFGYMSSRLEHDGNNYVVTVHDGNGKGTLEKTITVSERVGKAFDDLATVEDFGKCDRIITAWNLKLIENSVKTQGFASVGDFASLNYGIKANYANQLLNGAKAFLTEDENGVCFKYEWCKGVPFSNLLLILGRFNECENANEFYEKYLTPIDDDGNVLLPISNQSALKKAITDLNEKQGKASKKAQAKKAEQPTITPKAALAMVSEWTVANEIRFDSEAFDVIAQALAHIEKIMTQAQEQAQEQA